VTRIWLIPLFSLSLHAQALPEPEVDTVAANHQFTDGPAWSPEGFLIFADVPSSKVMKATEKGWVPMRENSGGATGHDFDDKGNLYTCESESRRVVRTTKKGEVQLLADRFEGKRLNGPNDVAVSKSGNVYFTDPAFGKQADKRELDFFGVYRITPKGVLSLVAKTPGRPNGIAISPKGDRLVVTSSDERNVRAWDVAKDGATTNERVLIPKVDGVPGGVEIDEQGRIWVAAKELTVYSPEGKLLNTFKLGESPTNLAFSGEPETVFVTARTVVYRLRFNAKGAGSH
jgi:gluconolactonase